MQDFVLFDFHCFFFNLVILLNLDILFISYFNEI